MLSLSHKQKFALKYLSKKLDFQPTIANTALKENGEKKKVVVSVDIEALKIRADNNHFEKLIIGKFGDRYHGFTKLMELSEKLCMRLSCFYDFCAYETYGKRIIDFAEEIIHRGHDLQLHAHPGEIDRLVWKKYGFQREPNCQNCTMKEADMFFEYLLNIFSKINTTVSQPVSFRGNSFTFNRNILESMPKYGLRVSSNYYPRSQFQQQFNILCPQFTWPNGIIELPISIVPSSFFYYHYFDICQFINTPEFLIKIIIERFYRKFGNNAILVIVLHSWSLLDMTNSGYFVPPANNKRILFFEKFFNMLSVEYDIVTISDIIKLNSLGNLSFCNINSAKLL
ncbi:MAG TPA: hypothetical protein DD381_10200 [Lentisphaeria bacterium]|nr:MAG: hypothetical protein A2X47_11975 [Lentisphaerae bacterium GWF2_38_69]HBM16696.1 hypothetical protein [Lentisphaeria bacterium]